jgi:hypothetical protein
MFPQSRWSRFASRMSLLAFLAALSAVTWSTPAQARTPGGVIGVGYYDHLGPPPWVEPACKFMAQLPCTCRPPAVASFDTVMGCSNTSQEWANRDAQNSCTLLCARAARNWPGTGDGNTGGTVGRPGGTTKGGVLLDGAGTVAAQEPKGYVGFVPFSEEPIGYSTEKERLAAAVVEATTVPWVFLEGMGETLQWEDPKGAAAFVQAYWSERGVPRPIGQCRYSLQVACPLKDVKLGDSLQVCSGESEEDAKAIAQTGCAPLRYDALSRTWGAWALYGIQSEAQHGAPAATVVAVGPGRFMGYLPASLDVVGIHEDWAQLAEELLERTAGTTVWLAGPAEFYAPEAR